jgi:hypothetical protein
LGARGSGDGGGGLAAALWAPRSRGRPPAGTGQGRVHTDSPSLVMTVIWVPSIRSVLSGTGQLVADADLGASQTDQAVGVDRAFCLYHRAGPGSQRGPAGEQAAG